MDKEMRERADSLCVRLEELRCEGYPPAAVVDDLTTELYRLNQRLRLPAPDGVELRARFAVLESLDVEISELEEKYGPRTA